MKGGKGHQEKQQQEDNPKRSHNYSRREENFSRSDGSTGEKAQLEGSAMEADPRAQLRDDLQLPELSKRSAEGAPSRVFQPLDALCWTRCSLALTSCCSKVLGTRDNSAHLCKALGIRDNQQGSGNQG